MQQGNKITGFRIPFTANARASLYHVTKFSLISSFAFYYYDFYYYLLLFVLFLVFLLFIIATAHYWPSSRDKKSCRHAV